MAFWVKMCCICEYEVGQIYAVLATWAGIISSIPNPDYSFDSSRYTRYQRA